MRTILFPPLALAALEVAGGPPAPLIWVERTVFVMGTVLEIRLAASDRTHALAASEAVLAAVRQTDDLLSTWRNDTELMRLNRARPGTVPPVDPELTALLSEVRWWSVATEGAFDPRIGALVDAWDLRGAGRLPSGAELRDAVSSKGWVDSGGFGKGAALRAARDTLAALGIEHALLNLGGQALALGWWAGRPWSVRVAHPSRRSAPASTPLGVLRLSGHSVSTTAQSERFIDVGGQRYGHVLDPRTGYPVSPWGSVTVVARDPLLADILSTALFVMGPQRGLDWVRNRPDIGALFLVTHPGDSVTPLHNPAMERFLPRHGSTLSRSTCNPCVH